MFTINKKRWEVVFVPPLDPHLLRPDGIYTSGCCDNSTKTIFISNAINSTYLRKVLCHEITHAVMFSYGVNLDDDEEEVIADTVATYGQEIIRVTNLLFYKLKGRY